MQLACVYGSPDRRLAAAHDKQSKRPAVGTPARRRDVRTHGQAFARRYARTASMNSCGRCRLLICPQLGMTTSVASGIRRSNWRATLSGDRSSSSPQISKVGTLTWWSAPVRSASAMAASCVARLFRRTSFAIFVQHRHRRSRPRPANRPRRLGSKLARDAPSMRCVPLILACNSPWEREPCQPA